MCMHGVFLHTACLINAIISYLISNTKFSSFQLDCYGAWKNSGSCTNLSCGFRPAFVIKPSESLGCKGT